MKDTYQKRMIPVGRMGEVVAGMMGFMAGVLFSIVAFLVWRYFSVYPQ